MDWLACGYGGRTGVVIGTAELDGPACGGCGKGLREGRADGPFEGGSDDPGDEDWGGCC